MIYIIFCIVVVIAIILLVNRLPKGNSTKEEIEDESRLW